MKGETKTHSRDILTRLNKQLVTTHNTRRICKASKKKDMIWLDPSDPSSLLEVMKNLMFGKKKPGKFQNTRIS